MRRHVPDWERQALASAAARWGLDAEPAAWEDLPRITDTEDIEFPRPAWWARYYRNALHLGTFNGGWTYCIRMSTNISGRSGPLSLYGPRFDDREAAMSAAIADALAWVKAEQQSNNSCRGKLTARMERTLEDWLNGLTQPQLF